LVAEQPIAAVAAGGVSSPKLLCIESLPSPPSRLSLPDLPSATSSPSPRQRVSLPVPPVVIVAVPTTSASSPSIESSPLPPSSVSSSPAREHVGPSPPSMCRCHAAGEQVIAIAAV
jgi:hypothetical protein